MSLLGVEYFAPVSMSSVHGAEMLLDHRSSLLESYETQDKYLPTLKQPHGNHLSVPHKPFSSTLLDFLDNLWISLCVFCLCFRFFIFSGLSESESWCAFPVLWFLSFCGSTRGSWSPSSIRSFHRLLIHSGPRKRSRRPAPLTKKLLKRVMGLAR